MGKVREAPGRGPSCTPASEVCRGAGAAAGATEGKKVRGSHLLRSTGFQSWR